jgi:hypothetical protein
VTPSAELVRTGLRYDLQAGQLILPNGLRVMIPTPLHGVLSAMMTKQPGRQAGFVVQKWGFWNLRLRSCASGSAVESQEWLFLGAGHRSWSEQVAEILFLGR